MDPSVTRGFAFLLSLGALPLGCTAGADEESSASATTDAATASATDTATTGETTGEGVGPCEARRVRLQECFPNLYPDISDEVARCEARLVGIGEVLGQACAEARAAVEGCYADLTCAELLESPSPCHEAHVAADEVCVVIPGPTCIAFGEAAVICDPSWSIEEAAELCQYSVDYNEINDGAACGEATEEFFACLSALPCAEAEELDACDDIDVSACAGG